MHLQIITPEKTVFDEDVDEVFVPTDKGQIGILPHHINLVTQITPGEMIIRTRGKDQVLAITGGFLEVDKDKTTILADYAEHAKDIDVEKAATAQRRAEELLSKKRGTLTEEEIMRIEGDLRRSLLQQHISERHRRRHTS